MHPRWQVRTERFVYIPMRDGVELAGDLARPKKDGCWPAVLMRTPYGKGGDLRELASHGFAVLQVDARGTGASGGRYDYYNMTEGLHDGYDLVEWLAAQPWCDGHVGTLGGSAWGIYQVLTGALRPPHLTCMCCGSYPLDFYTDQWYPGGVFRTQNRLGWIGGIRGRIAAPAVHAQTLADGESIAPENEARRETIYRERFRRTERERREGADLDAWARPYLDTPVRSEVWDRIDLTPLMREVAVPVLHSGVMYDHFGIGTVRGYREHPGPKRLVMRPGALGYGDEEGDMPEEDLRFLQYHLQHAQNDAMDANVAFYDTGAGFWREFEALPEETPAKLYIDNRGELGYSAADLSPTPVLRHDPEAPAASAPGRDYREFERQANVLVFTTAPLVKPMTVLGEAELNLTLRADMPDANVIGRLCAVSPDGVSHQLNFGAQRLTLREDLSSSTPLPRGDAFTATVKFWTVSHTFAPGTRLRLVLSLSDYPFFENAPHAGELAVEKGELTLPCL